MRASRSGDAWFLALQPGHDLVEAYRGFAREHRVEAAVVLAGIGMLKDPELGFFDGHRYLRTQLRGEHELVALQGNLALLDGEPFAHLHASVAGRDHVARGGHLFSGLVHVTHEGAVRVLEGVRLERARDAATGLALLPWA